MNINEFIQAGSNNIWFQILQDSHSEFIIIVEGKYDELYYNKLLDIYTTENHLSNNYKVYSPFANDGSEGGGIINAFKEIIEIDENIKDSNFIDWKKVMLIADSDTPVSRKRYLYSFNTDERNTINKYIVMTSGYSFENDLFLEDFLIEYSKQSYVRMKTELNNIEINLANDFHHLLNERINELTQKYLLLVNELQEIHTIKEIKNNVIEIDNENVINYSGIECNNLNIHGKSMLKIFQNVISKIKNDLQIKSFDLFPTKDLSFVMEKIFYVPKYWDEVFNRLFGGCPDKKHTKELEDITSQT